MTEQQLTADDVHDILTKEGWTFYGIILHYPNAYKDQGCIYTKAGEYIVSGLDAAGKNILRDPITPDEAYKRKEESLTELKKLLFAQGQ